jgi:TetR/AcrR family fatty acid metabolism transcriptional regulator
LAVQRRSEARREQIMRAAERVFARKGFLEATVSDVAREARVSDATIYEYFPSKEELLFSIPGETTRRGKERMESALRYVRGFPNRLRCIIYGYLSFYLDHPDYASVAMLILKQNRKFLETEAYGEVRELSRTILRIVEEGIAAGEVRRGTDPHLIRHLILGTIEHMVIRRLLLGGPENLLEYADPLTDLIVDGVGVQPERKAWHLRVILEPGDEPAGHDPLPGTKRAQLRKSTKKEI